MVESVVYKFIKVKRERHVCYLTLFRPEKRNAFTPTTVNEVAHAIQQINTDAEIKLVVLQAEGPVFCAGMDLKTFRDASLDVPNPAIANKDLSLGEVLAKLHKPSLALIEGDVIAGGFLYLLGCTYAFAVPSVRFRLPELSLGIFPFQVMASLLKVMPERKVLQMCLQTDYFSAEEALKWGIIDGYLQEDTLNTFIDRFSEVDATVMKMGFKAVRDLSDIPASQHYTHLKQVLDQLK